MKKNQQNTNRNCLKNRTNMYELLRTACPESLKIKVKLDWKISSAYCPQGSKFNVAVMLRYRHPITAR